MEINEKIAKKVLKYIAGYCKRTDSKYRIKEEVEPGRIGFNQWTKNRYIIGGFLIQLKKSIYWLIFSEGTGEKNYMVVFNQKKNKPSLCEAHNLSEDERYLSWLYTPRKQGDSLNPKRKEIFIQKVGSDKVDFSIPSNENEVGKLLEKIFLVADARVESEKITDTKGEGEVEMLNNEKTPGQRSVPLNQILYGPPGTGKTYNTVLEAVKICDDSKPDGDYEEAKKRYCELKEEGRIEFITFHQSYGYEEFIEGIRPVMHAEDEFENLNYRIEKGVFSKICNDAKVDVAEKAKGFGISSTAKVWKISIDGTGPSTTRDYCFQNNEARIGWDMAGDITSDHRSDDEDEYFESLGSNDQSSITCFSQAINPGDILLCIASRSEVAGIGVVTGGYFFDGAQRDGVRPDYKNVLPVHWIEKDKKIPFIELNGNVGFTLKTVYPLPRIAPTSVLEILNQFGMPLGLKDSAVTPYVLIIDEINRGNMSKIFGELITLIEGDKRIGAEHEMTVRLPVSGDEFGVPKNLHIIGTMNTADRSIAMMDTALRRRFEFQEMMPEPGLLDGIKVEGVDLKTMLQTLNDRIEILYDREHTIGHAYFMSLSSKSKIPDLASVFENKVIPLLAEYFFEDWEKIRMVLGDDQKDAKYQFIKKNNSDKKALFGPAASELIDWENLKTYSRNADALIEAESYIGIYQKLSKADTLANEEHVESDNT